MRLAVHLLVTLLGLGALQLGNTVFATEGDDLLGGGHGAHVHGVASLNLVLDGLALHLEFESPAMNLVGFEHRPSTEADRTRLSRMVEALREADRLFRFDEAAGCRLQDVKIASTQLEGDSVTHDQDRGDHHADVRAVYLFDCQRPSRLERLTVELFDHFPGVERLNVQFIVGDTQGSARLSPNDPAVFLR